MKRIGGLAGELALTEKIDFQMGTLGKAVGAAGGYLCGSRCMIDFLLHRARSFMFSTAQPAPVAAAARAGIALINSKEGERLAEQLWKNISFFQDAMRQTNESQSAILPLILGQEKRALSAAQQVWDLGFYVPSIRYPTVPRGRARLRITLSSAHERDAIEQLVGAIEKIIFS